MKTGDTVYVKPSFWFNDWVEGKIIATRESTYEILVAYTHYPIFGEPYERLRTFSEFEVRTPSP